METFSTDRCSGGLSKIWELFTGHPPPFDNCCCVHDYLYMRGGTACERAEADLALRRCVAGQGYRLWSWIVWIAVRLCGGSHFLYRGAHAWGWGPVRRILVLIGRPTSVEQAVVSVEEAAEVIRETIRGAEKRAAAIEALMEEFRPWWLPKAAFRFFAGRRIDAAVAELNEEYGHDWGIYP